MITDVPIWLLAALQGTNGQMRNENQNDSRFLFVNTLSKSQQQQINVISRRCTSADYIPSTVESDVDQQIYLQQLNTFNKNLMREIYASEILSFYKDDVLK